MPMMEIVKGEKERPLILMTRPDKNPAEVPAILIGYYLKKGYKKGYKESEAITKKRAANKINLVAENQDLRKQIAKLESYGAKRI